MAMTGPEYARTLAVKLAATADKIRPLQDKFGLRPYTVRIVKVRWSGHKIGVGVSTVESVIDLSPTPATIGLGHEIDSNFPGGAVETGVVTVSEISAVYTYEELAGMTADGQATDPNLDVFYEIEKFKPDGTSSDKKRYNLDSVPIYVPGKLGWTVRLKRSQGDRLRDGAPHR